MREIYLIIKQGIYRHDIFGAYSDSKEAAAKAKSLATTDIDSYHNYVVQPILLDRPICFEVQDDWQGHKAKEPVPGVSFCKP